MDKSIYTCGDCDRVIYLMEAGRNDVISCCDKKMKEMSAEEKEKYLKEKEPFHPYFPKPGSP